MEITDDLLISYSWWIVGINQIANILRRIRPPSVVGMLHWSLFWSPSLVGDTTSFQTFVSLSPSLCLDLDHMEHICLLPDLKYDALG